MKSVATFVISALGLAFSQASLAGYWVDTHCTVANVEVNGVRTTQYFCSVEVRGDGLSGYGVHDPYGTTGSDDYTTRKGTNTAGSGTNADPKVFTGRLDSASACTDDNETLETLATGLFFANGQVGSGTPNGKIYRVKLSDGNATFSWMLNADTSGSGTSRPLVLVGRKCAGGGQ